MVARAAELAAQPGHYATDQFNNPYIIPDHRDNLGREIWEQTDGRVTAFCHGMGTASSVIGVSEALRPAGVFIQAHEPASLGGDQRRRTGTVPDPGLDRPRHAALGCRQGGPRRADRRRRGDRDDASPRAEEGIFAGISTGANVVGAHRLAERLGPDAVIVTLAVDTGFKYTSVSPFADLYGQSA